MNKLRLKNHPKSRFSFLLNSVLHSSLIIPWYNVPWDSNRAHPVSRSLCTYNTFLCVCCRLMSCRHAAGTLLPILSIPNQSSVQQTLAQYLHHRPIDIRTYQPSSFSRVLAMSIPQAPLQVAVWIQVGWWAACQKNVTKQVLRWPLQVQWWTRKHGYSNP